jgi:hypothetical protein
MDPSVTGTGDPDAAAFFVRTDKWRQREAHGVYATDCVVEMRATACRVCASTLAANHRMHGYIGQGRGLEPTAKAPTHERA